MPENKTKPTDGSVSTFVAGIPDVGRRADAEVLIDLIRDVTGEPPILWGPSIIGFGRHRYHTASGRAGESPVVGFSPRKAATVLYLSAGFSAAEEVMARLGTHTTGKACVYIKRLADVDLAVLRELLQHSVSAVGAGQPSPPVPNR